MLSPYGLEIIESCITCKLRADRVFCDLSPAALRTFEAIKFPITYPHGATLFVAGQAPRGVFVLCKGRVKLSASDMEGSTVIAKISEPGEVLGLGAAVLGNPYQFTAETIDPCQVNFIKRDDFVRILKTHAEVCLKVAEQLSEKYASACEEIRSLGLSHSASEKLARLLLHWCSMNGEASKQEPRLRMALSHKEIGQLIGSSRETVSRLLSEMRRQHIVQSNRSTLVIRNKSALKAMAARPVKVTAG